MYVANKWSKKKLQKWSRQLINTNAIFFQINWFNARQYRIKDRTKLKNTVWQDSGLGFFWPHSEGRDGRVRRTKELSHCMISIIIICKSLFLNVQQPPRQLFILAVSGTLWQGTQKLKQEWN